jgi:probable F420-dependent oxidoreductase
MNLGRVGLWTSALDQQTASVVRETVAEIEALGFGTLWVGEAWRREAFSNAALLLSASEGLVVATGIANIWARDPVAMAAGQRTLAEAWGGRFLLGLGVSHQSLVAPRRHRYERPIETMRSYLDAMDGAPYMSPAPEPSSLVRLLAALGPRMLALAAERADGAHTYLVPAEHTLYARATLGPAKLLCPEVAVALEHGSHRGRDAARAHVAAYLELENYRRNLTRLGFSDAELTGGGSERLVDRLVARGTVEAAARRVREHLDAGADHVAVQVLTDDRDRLPVEEWRLLGQAFQDFSRTY